MNIFKCFFKCLAIQVLNKYHYSGLMIDVNMAYKYDILLCQKHVCTRVGFQSLRLWTDTEAIVPTRHCKVRVTLYLISTWNFRPDPQALPLVPNRKTGDLKSV